MFVLFLENRWILPDANALSYRERWKTWRATLWLLSGITALTTVSTFFFLPETSSSNILLRRAERLRAQPGNPAYGSITEMESPSENLAVRIVKDMGNDLQLACLDPVILFVNLHMMLVYGVLYLWFEFFPIGKLGFVRCILSMLD
jgi:DHA1 family multidrug resistance protein-like MFS transporter